MSDFDKEAEREKLREKYEKDQQRRETTEKMSELLLQGATMTNSHCADCGDPIFRYDGQEFCPTCERPVDSGGDEQDADDAADDQETIRVTEPSDDARVKFGGESQTDAQPADHARQPVDDQRGQPDSTAGQSGGEQSQQTGRTEGQSIPSSDPARSPDTPSSSGTDRPADAADVAAARDSLVRTLTKFSQQAEATDDPQRARNSLAAAREAAETLAALRR